jgi:MFS family permease
MKDKEIVDLILGSTSGVALGALLFFAFLSLIIFITSYVYENKIAWETKVYLSLFACTCVVLVLLSAVSFLVMYKPLSFEEASGAIRSLWGAKSSRLAALLSSLVVWCASMILFLVGPFETAQRIRLQLAPTPKQPVDTSNNLVVETDIPARLDRLPWGSFHTLVAVGLGVTWILNGLEVTLAGNLSPALEESPILSLSSHDVFLANSTYICGLVLGSLFFGWLTDRLGRKKLFFITLLVYLLSTALTASSWDFASLALFRFVTGMGIGGEYAAINSTIQELIPARFRGRTDLLISGTFWIGAAIGALGSTVLLDPTIINPEVGWRVAFLIGAALAIIVLGVRRAIPESPRWLMTHNRVDEAEAIVASIEDKFRGQFDATERQPYVHLIGRTRTPLVEVVQTVFQVYPGRAVVSFSLMAAQALVYNAIFFTHALMLKHFFCIPSSTVGWYFLFFAAGNFLGPLMLGRLFDTFGRRWMIAATYAISGVLLAISGYLFMIDVVSALTQSLAWMVTFFFASAASSAAYLTAGEIFPLEIRALAIAFFFAVGTGIGGVTSQLLFAVLIDEGRASIYYSGYLVLSTAMIAAALIELLWGVPAERKPLEDVARPLTFVK